MFFTCCILYTFESFVDNSSWKNVMHKFPLLINSFALVPLFLPSGYWMSYFFLSLFSNIRSMITLFQYNLSSLPVVPPWLQLAHDFSWPVFLGSPHHHPGETWCSLAEPVPASCSHWGPGAAGHSVTLLIMQGINLVLQYSFIISAKRNLPSGSSLT